MAEKKEANLKKSIKEFEQEMKEENVEERKESMKEESKRVELNIATLSKVQKELDRKPSILEKYPYISEDGEIIYEVWKMKNAPQPYYTMRPQENGEARVGLGKNISSIPYNLPNVLKAKEDGTVIIVTEGERKANAFNEIGLTATAVIGKSTDKWRPKYNKYVKYANVLIIADNDDKGREFANLTFDEISDVANNVGILELSSLYPQLKEGGDIEDIRKIVNDDNYLKEVLDSVIEDFMSDKEVQ